jgi:hypothetical protein
MNISNLALIFTPVIFHDFNQVDQNHISDWSPDDLFEDLILRYRELFHEAEENAYKKIRNELQEAMEGKSPFKQNSQSNLLYIINSLTPPQTNNNLLLTQPMNPPIPANTSGGSSPGGPLNYQHNVNYPPQITTLGTAPPSSAMPQNQQRMASLQQMQPQPQPQQTNYVGNASRSLPPINTDLNAQRIVPQRYQPEFLMYQQQHQAPRSAASSFMQASEQFIMNRSISENTITQRGSSMANNTPTTETAPYVTFSGPNSNGYVNNISPLPTREVQPQPPPPPTTTSTTLKRHSGTPQPPMHAKSIAPPRQDSLRKPNTHLQENQEKTDENIISPVPNGHRQSPLPSAPMLSSSISATDTSVPPQKHAHYQPNTVQDFSNLSTVIEGESLDAVPNYPATTATTTAESSALEPIKK